MNSAKHETIADIVAEMRSNEFDDPSFNIYSLVAARTLARGWADRIEAAVNQPVTNCNRLGNAAAMREALSDACYAMFDFLKTQNGGYEEMAKALDKAKAALAAPPRNCDLFATPKEAGEAFISQACENPCGNCTVSEKYHNPLIHECGIEWLFAEAKGGAK